MKKDQWLEEFYQELCANMGSPENEQEEKNLREWASESIKYFDDDYSPKDACQEELSYGAD